MPYLKPGDTPPTKGKGSRLGAKQERFIEEYMVDLNAAAAVLRAGYKCARNQHRLGAELLRHPLIAAEVKKRTDERRERRELTADYVLDKLVTIVEQTESGNPAAALRGLELLGKHLGLYKDRTEISGPDGGAIETEQRVREDVNDFTSRISSLAKRTGTSGVSEFPKPGSDS